MRILYKIFLSLSLSLSLSLCLCVSEQGWGKKSVSVFMENPCLLVIEDIPR
jgi:hypothetical protein